MKDGARGWVAGSLICLWFSAVNRHGPMLIGWISRNGSATRIIGRAGSDLDGLLLLVAITPFMAFALFSMANAGDVSFVRLAFVGGIYVLICAAGLWAKHVFRRDAEPLIRFLRDVANKQPMAGRTETALATGFSALTLSVNGEDYDGMVSSESIHDALLGVGPDGFAILSSAPESYIQTAWQDGGFIIEKRDGTEGRHFRAAKSQRIPLSGEDASSLFTFDEVLAVFIAHASGVSTTEPVTWVAIKVPR